MRVIPNSAVARAQRFIVLRKPISPFMIEAAVGGAPMFVESFDSILVSGISLSCKVYCRKEPMRGTQAELRGNAPHEPRTNAFANLLWLQALVRKTGFSEAKTPCSFTSSVAVVYGDEEFLSCSFEKTPLMRGARAVSNQASEDSILASKSFDRRRARLIQPSVLLTTKFLGRTMKPLTVVSARLTTVTDIRLAS
jgi:hypothetical protein